MKEPLTEELLEELRASATPESFLSGHRLKNRDLAAYLRQLLVEKGLEQARVVHEAGLNATYGYEIFTGKKKAPGRDKLLQLIFAMGLTLQEANRVLERGGVSRLYCKDRRDAIIIFCLDHGYTLQRTEEELYRFGEPTIC